MPYRGVDSTYSNRHCSSGEGILDPDTGLTIGINVTTNETVCNHYEQDEIEHIPTITQNVAAALEVLSKDDDGVSYYYSFPPLLFWQRSAARPIYTTDWLTSELFLLSCKIVSSF